MCVLGYACMKRADVVYGFLSQLQSTLFYFELEFTDSASVAPQHVSGSTVSTPQGPGMQIGCHTHRAFA